MVEVLYENYEWETFTQETHPVHTRYREMIKMTVLSLTPRELWEMRSLDHSGQDLWLKKKGQELFKI